VVRVYVEAQSDEELQKILAAATEYVRA
jgi:phosphomannomutase